jgi:DHA1 family bicyclomycin/chloramphenicol resistance-like MFS transporter
MESQSHIAGSVSALLGLIPFLLGLLISPLVGIAGEYTAVPLGVIVDQRAGLVILFGPGKKTSVLARLTSAGCCTARVT